MFAQARAYAQDHPGQLSPSDHSTVLNNLAVLLHREGKLAEAEARQVRNGPSRSMIWRHSTGKEACTI